MRSSVVSCGTLIYPERKGTKTGRLDVGVVLLDALGLLFGLIPGVIAFAVDLSTGAIYLPGTSAHLQGDGKYRIVRFNPRTATKESLETLISRETGIEFHFNDKRIQYSQPKNTDEIAALFQDYQNETRMELVSAAR